MNTLTEHDRKLSETLRSLSLDAPAASTGRLPRLALLSGVILAVAAGLAIALWPQASAYWESPATTGGSQTRTEPADATTTGAPPPVPVHEVTGSGYLIAPHSTTVFAKYEGRITQVAIEIGDRVAAGQPLVVLEDAGARFSLDEARIGQASARLALAARRITADQARATLERKEALANVLSRQEVEDARTALARAGNDVAQAEQDVDKAKLSVAIARERIDALTVRAPIAGVVTRLGAHVGDTVLARADSTLERLSLATIVDTNSMVIEADVAEANMALLRPGLLGEAVLDGFSDRPFAVEVLRVSPSVSPEKGTVGLRLLPKAPPEGMRPGMAARIRLATTDPQRGAKDR
ncbi:efflux RND transporter periplasmic adaptor subunit [Pleomorphomonas sp. NRK KF1]|uniref:efflux RND transporter periplasmic adaptor subunit n=1 Tax=Pleomorphomonas sp. NRK KF1 TaxID=2943000 RepID=UPI002042C50D|nr:efflux RND transporter periplasmic adaptor subunit [Pleomorphomonas sp. NRK KF1]MCM5555123.1 efflux RND transporter periplasmic adaptor subunit [Pleomorphomonas sp. NRK KF1]